MASGYRGEGIFFSGTLADGQTVAKGDPAAFDADGNLVAASAGETDPVGVFAEDGDTSGTKSSEDIAVVVHGVVGVTANGAISAGDAVRVATADGSEVETLSSVTVDEGGTATHDLEPNVRLGQALEDIAADEVGDVFVNTGQGVA